jgi:hypothetical protein
MQTPENPVLTRLPGVKPMNGHLGAVYRIDPPIVLDDGTPTSYVTTSIGSEIILGEGNTFAVFASDAHGRFLDWSGIYVDDEGPDWCLALIGDT